MKNLVVVGDLHAREKEPYYSQWRDFMSWLFESEHNNSNNQLLLLGDLVESISVQHELLETYVDYFSNHSKFEKVFILTGNHDRTLDSNLLSIFRPIKNVEVIDTYKSEKIGECECLFLPHIEHKLIETYSKLENKHYDYCFHHIEDETQHFGKKYVDLSYLTIDNYLCGHIHTETVSHGGHFLGSPTYNSLNEKDKTPIIAIVNLETKKYELVKVPITISYLSVSYPNDIEIPKTKYGIFTIHDSIDKEQSINFYIKQAKEKKFNFYARRVHSKKIKNDKLDESSNDYIKEKTLIEHFNEYKLTNNIDSDIGNICINTLSKVEEKSRV